MVNTFCSPVSHNQAFITPNNGQRKETMHIFKHTIEAFKPFSSLR